VWKSYDSRCHDGGTKSTKSTKKIKSSQVFFVAFVIFVPSWPRRDSGCRPEFPDRASSEQRAANPRQPLRYPQRVTITFDDFQRVDIRVGRVVSAEGFPEARKPAYKLVIDFGGEIGTRRSSAQLTRHYTPETLVGRQVLAVVNFPPRQIGPFMSEVLTLGVPDADGEVVLVTPEREVPTGGRMF
jgi:tRNA-binding protein